MPSYADIILPLPLDGLFTYSVPDALTAKVGQGKRVTVPFGRTKTYVGLVAKVHSDKPSFTVKDIRDVLDESPVVTDVQLRLWRWLSSYYMAAIGDVFKAALPAGLKEEEGYRPRTELYVALGEAYRTEQAVHLAMSILGKARKQQEAFATFLRMSHWDTIEGERCAVPVVPVTREELLNESHATLAIVKALVDKKILITYKREVGRLNVGGEPNFDQINKLNAPQQDAYNKILFSFMKRNVVLLHGVTSSGKTEIYIQLIKKAIDDHQQVLYLLPEIALTVQITSRLQKVFGSRMGIYHSKYSDAERVEMWQKQLSDSPYDIILGARSAVFLPFQRLGLVIVDEEHETSYKQQDPAPRYHARSAAIVLAQMSGAKTLLGTATPSMESYYNAKTGKYGLVELMERYKGVELPEIQVVDIRDLRRRKMMNGPFSPQLLASIRDALKAGKQALLFQNRRGFAPMIECHVCGWVPKCQNCDVSLTYHKTTGLLTCHYCGYTMKAPAVCPNCGSPELRGRGYGTEKIEDYISSIFPEARIARMDLDTTRTRLAYERLINDFSEGKTNLLIGTQMVSKGLDFGNVMVVGILDADGMLNYPDFRAYEHAFTMMSQVSGRAGRRGKRGLVILQTRSPELPVIGQVMRNDYVGFYNDLLAERQAFHYPPFYHLVYVYVKHRDEPTAEHAAADMAMRLRQWFGARVLGPDKPSVGRVMTLYIRKIVIKLETGIDLTLAKQYLRRAQAELLKDKKYAAATVYYDVDPE